MGVGMIRLDPLVGLGGFTLVLVSAVTITMAFQNEERRQVRRYERWYVEGPACPT